MKPHTFVRVFLACGFLAASAPAFAQTTETAPPANWRLGGAGVTFLGRDDVASSKFEEYRVVPKGISMPEFFIKGSENGTAYSLIGRNISQTDQRYTGFVRASWIGVAFDYNQIPHQMGNDAHLIEQEVAPGVWSMSSTLRGALGTAVDTRLPTSTRTYDFYNTLFAPTIAAAGLVDLDSLRQTGNFEVDLGRKLPFDLKATYFREAKTGYRGNGGGVVYSNVNDIVELPQSLDELTQDIGFRAAWNKAWGNVYGGFDHNWYNNRLETTIFDNPLRPSDLAYTAAAGAVPALGGPGSGRLIGPADNSADRGYFGAMFKFDRQTRVTFDGAVGQWLQNAQLYPYTINTTILTTSGVRADSLAALDAQSLNGKIDTRTFNVGFTSRPFAGLGVRARYRTYDLDNKTVPFVRTGTVGNAPDRSWTAVTAANLAESPFGFETASPYGYKTARFDLQGSYDIKTFTIEGTYRDSRVDRTYREALKGKETGGSVALILHTSDWLLFRGVFDKSTRRATELGDPDDTADHIGLQADESDRDTTRAGINLELSAGDKLTFMLAYIRRHDDYPNRPDRVTGVANTSNGLLSAAYDSYTAEADLTFTRAEFGAFYTYENNLSTTRYGSSSVLNMLTFDGSDKTNTFGGYAHLVLVPDKWMIDANAQSQKLDGLMAITGDPAGSFNLARLAYGGIQDITGYDDTLLTSANVQLRYMLAKSWDFNVGYFYEKYTLANDYTSSNEVFPAIGGFYLKANNGNYTANVGYVRVNLHF